LPPSKRYPPGAPGPLPHLRLLIDQFYSQVQKMGGTRWDTSSLIALLER
jgi:hypothetical protein